MSNYQDVVLRLQAIFDAAVDGIIVIDHRGLIEEVNTASCRLFGYEERELIGYNINMLMPANDSMNHDRYIKDYQTTRQPKIIGAGREVKGKKKNGDEFPFWLAVSEVKLEERVIYTGFIHDLTSIKNAEIKLLAANEELEKKVVERTYELENVVNQLLFLNRQFEEEITNKMRIQNQLKERENELERSLVKERELGELKSRFVSMASHEFRTPLSTILSSVSLIGRYVSLEEQPQREKHINKIKSSVSHLTVLLNDFLSLNKLEEGKIPLNYELFNPDELCHEVIEEMRTILKSKQTIILNKEKEIEMMVTDKKILKNTLINLISNAIKYSSEDGEISCTLKISENWLEIKVMDQGIGIPDEDQKHLFDRFFRASNVTNIEGTGLGLNIVKKYLEMVEGEISFESKIYKGTTFKVTIPNKLNEPNYKF